jgi:phosphatidate cytidylyltransferase
VSAGQPAQRSSNTGSAVGRPDNLALRIVSALVLAPLTILIAWIGGWAFVAFWGLAAVGIALEWTRVIGVERQATIQIASAVLLACATALAALGLIGWAAAAVLAGALLAAALADQARRAWFALGVVYAGAVLIAPAVLRRDPDLGFAALMFLFAVVWATDIFGYLSARRRPGPARSEGRWAGFSPASRSRSRRALLVRSRLRCLRC